jgi:hypothetical protein
MKIFRKENITPTVIIILIATVFVLSVQYYNDRQDLIITTNNLNTFHYNQNVLTFAKLFVVKVLKADGQVSFDDRLMLENAVRNINDKTIFDQWQKFINANTAMGAQIEVKNLLELLVNKIMF